MSDVGLVTRLLGTGREDAGCEGGFLVLAEYVERELDGQDVARLFPAVAEHLRNCPACVVDHAGVVALVRGRA
jgi:hypothetical protein